LQHPSRTDPIMHLARKNEAESSANGSLAKGVSPWMVDALVTTLTLTSEAFSWKPFASEWDRDTLFTPMPQKR
jgi:hydroxyethylthiazole kinase-like sugar kinase family protein